MAILVIFEKVCSTW